MQIHLKYTNTIFCLVACTKKLSKVTILFDLIILLLIWIQGVRTNYTKNLTTDEEKVGGKDLVGLGVTLRCLARLSPNLVISLPVTLRSIYFKKAIINIGLVRFPPPPQQ